MNDDRPEVEKIKEALQESGRVVPLEEAQEKLREYKEAFPEMAACLERIRAGEPLKPVITLDSLAEL